MQKIYGYKQADLIGLACLIKNCKHLSLSQILETYSIKSGKAKGTVRNIYYALVKVSQTDKEFTAQHLNGTPLKSNKINTFDKSQEDKLISQIVSGVQKGQSVRQIVLELAGGDGKLALRYQNKYRNLLCKNPTLLYKVKTAKDDYNELSNVPKAKISQPLIDKLKKEIDALVQRIALKDKKDNDFLRKRVAFLEAENLKLSKIVYGGSIESQAVKFFSSPNGAHVIH